MAYISGTILDYFSGNEFALGTVVKDGDGGRVQLKAVKTDVSTKIPNRQIIASYGLPSGKQAPAEIQASIDAELASIDTAFIWEIFVESPGEHSFAEISENYYGDQSPLHLSVLARALFKDPEHFHRIQNSFSSIQVRSREDYEEYVNTMKMRAERAAQREKSIAWITEAIGYKGEAPFPVPPEYENLITSTIDYIMCGTNSEAVNLLSRTVVLDKKNARENAIALLKKTNRMPEGADEFLLANGIHAAFSKSVMEYADSLKEEFDHSDRTVVSEELVFSIDDAETREIDDALSCRRDGDNYIVGVYIADPACYVSKGDPLDETAEERPLSLYLPTTTVKMFPDHLSCDLASLNQGKKRPTLAFTMTMSEEGEILDWNICSAIVTVTRRLTYIEADAIMESPSPDETPLADALKNLLVIADNSREFRESDGAVVLNRPELRVRVKNGEVSVESEDQNSPSHRLVAEFMVLANSLAAKYALRYDIPVIYRVQDPPSGPVTSVHEYEPYFFDQQVRKMKRTHLSTYPQPHFGLGLDLYIQISSPLRRYADLVMHRQLAAHALGKPIPYTQEELFVVLNNVESTASQNRVLENEANKYWMLEYLRRNCIGQKMGATVMRVEGAMVLAELDYYCERGVVITRDKPSPGEHIQITIKEVYPDSGRLVLQR